MIVCSKCGGTDIAEFRLVGYDPNKFRDYDYNVPVKGGVDYPVEYTWCSDCNTEHIDLIDDWLYNAQNNSTE